MSKVNRIEKTAPDKTATSEAELRKKDLAIQHNFAIRPTIHPAGSDARDIAPRAAGALARP